MNKTVLGIFAHPDDAELMCVGTLSLLKKAGWEVHIATMTPGDKGSAELTREEISVIRRAEGAKAAERLGGTYHCLECDDVYIMYDRETINKATTLIRKVQPTIVITASPNCYMIDHETTSLVAQTACFGAGIKNMEAAGEPYGMVPYLYYVDPMEGKDKFGVPVIPGFYVDITGEIGIKEETLACHASQREWLRKHHKMDQYLIAMKQFAAHRGAEISVKYAEGFRQHLGHGYPQDNILKAVIGDLVVIR
ncbi:MAG: PIG-L family deacetylase [Mariniphaga sp.]